MESLKHLRLPFPAVLGCSALGLVLASKMAIAAPQNIYELSLEELANVSVEVAGLTAIDQDFRPSSITIISQQQIQQSSARNLFDLIETYVPGALYNLQNINSQNFKLRGVGERNYSILLLINGRPMNQKNFAGAAAELRNWNFSDLKRIEVVRGPGSATYGSGAITGVINIVTVSADDFQGLQLGLQHNEEYDSTGIDISWGKQLSEAKWYLNASITDTDGSTGAAEFQTLRNGELGYKGTDAFSGRDSNPLSPYLSDYESEPHIKLHADVSFLNNWRFWARYSNSGQMRPGSEIEYQGELRNRQQFQYRYALAVLEQTTEFNQALSLESHISYDSEDYFQVRTGFDEAPPTEGVNRRRAWQEEEWFARFTLQWKKDNFTWANALEYNHAKLGPGWGDEAKDFRANIGSLNYISSNSIFLGDGSGGTLSPDDVTQFTSGWSIENYAWATEFNWRYSDSLNTVLSLRIDDNQFAGTLTSPRLSATKRIADKHFFRATWQRSNRANTLVELYTEGVLGLDSEPEQTDSAELSYRYAPGERIEFIATPYYTRTEIITWSGERAEKVGDADIKGLELELNLNYDNWSLGFNHSYNALNDWTFTAKQDDGSLRQDISLSDFNYREDFLLLQSTGDHLINWAHNISKFWFNYSWHPDWRLHLDARIFWDREYGEDLETMYANAYAAVDTSQLSAAELADFSTARAGFDTWVAGTSERDAFERDIRFDASLTWTPGNSNFMVVVFAQNLINFTDNKRYSQPFFRTLPVIGWTEEPRAFGVKIKYWWN